MKLIRDMLRQRDDELVLMKLLREVTAGFVGITDCPGSMFVPELLQLYPNAKVVLVKRDPERWVQSMAPVYKHWNPWWFKYLAWPYPGWRWLSDIMDDVLDKYATLQPERMYLDLLTNGTGNARGYLRWLLVVSYLNIS